jgi:hypothetical protein
VCTDLTLIEADRGEQHGGAPPVWRLSARAAQSGQYDAGELRQQQHPGDKAVTVDGFCDATAGLEQARVAQT